MCGFAPSARDPQPIALPATEGPYNAELLQRVKLWYERFAHRFGRPCGRFSEYIRHLEKASESGTLHERAWGQHVAMFTLTDDEARTILTEDDRKFLKSRLS